MFSLPPLMGLYVIVIDVIFRNPYGFYRRWQIPGDGEANFVDQIQSKYLEKEFNSHVQKLKKQIEEQSNSYKAQMELLEKTQKEQIEEQKKQHQHLLRLLGARSESDETADTGDNSVDPPLANSSALVDPPLNSLTKINEKVKGNSKRINKGKSIVIKKKQKKNKNGEGTSQENDPDYTPPSNEEDSSETEGSQQDNTESESDSESENGTKYFSSKSDVSVAVKNQTLVKKSKKKQTLPLASFGDGETVVYVQELSLDLCSDPLDQLQMANTEDEAVYDYIRMQTTNGFMNSMNSNAVTYEKFTHGYYICAFDLSTANDGTNNRYSIPSVRQGKK
jgi:hypothetical protein